MKDAHTPTKTPWKLIDTVGSVSIHAQDIEILNYYSPVPSARANAALIVRAVNSHEALVKCLQKWAETKDPVGLFQDQEYMDECWNALNLAKGEQTDALYEEGV